MKALGEFLYHNADREASSSDVYDGQLGAKYVSTV